MHAARDGGQLTPPPADRPPRVQPHRLTVRIVARASPTSAETASVSSSLEHLQPALSPAGGEEWDLVVTVLADSQEEAREYVDRVLGGVGGRWIDTWSFAPE